MVLEHPGDDEFGFDAWCEYDGDAGDNDDEPFERIFPSEVELMAGIRRECPFIWRHEYDERLGLSGRYGIASETSAEVWHKVTPDQIVHSRRVPRKRK